MCCPLSSPPFADRCGCSFPFTYCISGKCTTSTTCTTVSSPGKPWCVADTSGNDDYDYDDYDYDYDACKVDGRIPNLSDPSSTVGYVWC